MKPDPQSLIPGYRIRYVELEETCSYLRDQGWSGFISFDEAVKTLGTADFNFKEKVGRFVIDGIIDPELYLNDSVFHRIVDLIQQANSVINSPPYSGESGNHGPSR